MAQEWKLKELSKLDLNNYDKVEAEVEGIEGGKVVIVKVQDKIHALNANCTHFGAPLKNGVLSPDGRLDEFGHSDSSFRHSPQGSSYIRS